MTMTKNGNKRPERRVDQISLSRWHNLVPGLWLRDASQVSAAQSATLFNDITRPAAPVPASPGAVTWTPGPYEERLGYAAFAGLLFIAFLLSFDNASVNQDHFSFVFLYLVWCQGGIGVRWCFVHQDLLPLYNEDDSVRLIKIIRFILNSVIT